MLYEVLERVGPKDVFCLLDEELRTTKRSRVHPVIIAKALGYEGPNVLTDVSIAIPRQHARNLPPMQRGLLLAEAYSLAVSRETALLDKATQENNGGEKFEAKKNLALLELHFSRIAARLKGLGLPL